LVLMYDRIWILYFPGKIGNLIPIYRKKKSRLVKFEKKAI